MGRNERNRAAGGIRVRVFIDYSNFQPHWKKRTKASPQQNLRWDRLPHAIINQLDTIKYLAGTEKEMRAIKVYASYEPGETESEVEFNRWLREDLDQLPGYTVDISAREKADILCEQENCRQTSEHYIEKGVDTKIAIDMLALAMRDLYDVGVLVTDDADLIPSTECVQDILDKHIVHLGFAGQKNDLRSASWSHLTFETMLPSILASTIRKGVPAGTA